MRKYQWIKTIILIYIMVCIASCTKVKNKSIPVVTGKPLVQHIAEPVDVMIYIGHSSWITIEKARIEAGKTMGLLTSNRIQASITESDDTIKNWMVATTSNGSVNVCILYGVMPTTIYEPGNSQTDGSIAEKWIETTDGDTILNQGDYFGYYSSDDNPNYKATLQNLMDLPHVDINVENFEDLLMQVTEDGNAFTPSLANFESDRPFPLKQLGGEWFAEKIFASSTGDVQETLSDPVILRDGDLGRLAIVYQTHHKDNPKGEVAAEIIMNYLLAE